MIKKRKLRVVNVFERELKDQLIRKGFEVTGVIGDDVEKKKRYTLYGDITKITPREEPFIEHFGKPKKRKEQIYTPMPTKDHISRMIDRGVYER